MKTFNTILQGSEAVEAFAIDFARGFDFSQDDVQDYNTTYYNDQYVDTVQGIEVYYNRTADYYFFSADYIQIN